MYYGNTNAVRKSERPYPVTDRLRRLRALYQTKVTTPVKMRPWVGLTARDD